MTTPATMTRAAFARHLDVKPSYITKLGHEDRLVLTPDGKKVMVAESIKRIEETKDGNRADVAQRHAESRGKKKAPKQDTKPKETTKGSDEPTNPKNKPVDGMQDSKARREHYRAKKEEAEYMQMIGQLLQREGVDFVLKDFGGAFRALMENMADRLTPMVYPLKTMDEIHAAITEYAEEAQTSMAERMRRKREEVHKSDG